MPITRADVERTAQLARIDLRPEETDLLVEQLSSILDTIAAIAQVDTSSLPPTAQILPLRNVLRADEVQPSLPPDVVLANAPAREGDFFRVRAVLEGEEPETGRADL